MDDDAERGGDGETDADDAGGVGVPSVCGACAAGSGLYASDAVVVATIAGAGAGASCESAAPPAGAERDERVAAIASLPPTPGLHNFAVG
jgi:hypothetical protein